MPKAKSRSAWSAVFTPKPKGGLKLYAFLLREEGRVNRDVEEHLELVFGDDTDKVANSVRKKYGPDLSGIEVKMVGALPAEEFIHPIVEDIYEEKIKEKQQELFELSRKTRETRANNFICNLKYSGERWKDILGTADKKALDRIIGKLEKVRP